jgi:hypothetical protein
MGNNQVLQSKLEKDISELGRGVLSVQYPNDIEVYLAALELVDSESNSIEYFMFPIMPNSISKTENNRISMRKSSSGTTVLMSPSEVPSEISIKGNFGKSFKIISTHNNDNQDFFIGIFSSGSKDALTMSFNNYSNYIKSGYGCIKILQNIIKTSNKLDGKFKPYQLYFYNMALGEYYLVVIPPGGFNLNQDYGSNMIWNYSLNMLALAKMEDIRSIEKNKDSMNNALNTSFIQRTINSLAGEIKNIL